MRHAFPISWYLYAAIGVILFLASATPAISRTSDDPRLPPTPVSFLALSAPAGAPLPEPVIEVPTPHENAPVERLRASVSGYTAHHDETDDTPDITANGDRVYVGGIACPTRYAFGTEVRINGRTYTCNDRMNARYRAGNYFDIFMSSKSEAIHWGRRTIDVEVVL